MGFGGTAKKLQKVTEMAEDVYTRMNELRDQVVQMRETTKETSDRVGRLEREAAEMRALLDALAEKEGIDVDSVTADAHIHEAESADGDADAETGGDSEVVDGDGTAGDSDEVDDSGADSDSDTAGDTDSAATTDET